MRQRGVFQIITDEQQTGLAGSRCVVYRPRSRHTSERRLLRHPRIHRVLNRSLLLAGNHPASVLSCIRECGNHQCRHDSDHRNDDQKFNYRKTSLSAGGVKSRRRNVHGENKEGKFKDLGAKQSDKSGIQLEVLEVGLICPPVRLRTGEPNSIRD